MKNNNLNEFVPSILRPRTIRKVNEKLSSTQNSIKSLHSLSLKRCNKNNTNKRLNENSIPSHQNFSLGRNSSSTKVVNNSYQADLSNKDNLRINDDIASVKFTATENTNTIHPFKNQKNASSVTVSNSFDSCNKPEEDFLQFSDIEVISNVNRTETESFPFSLNDSQLEAYEKNTYFNISDSFETNLPSKVESNPVHSDSTSELTVIYNLQPIISVSFSMTDCDNLDISTNKSNIKKVSISRDKSNANFDCEIVEGSQLSDITGSENSSNMNESNSPSAQKRKVAAINLEIKKRKMSTEEQSTEKDKVLILKTNAIEKLTHVIVQPPNYKLVKRKIKDKSKGENGERSAVLGAIVKNGKKVENSNLKQRFIDNYFRCTNVLKRKEPPDKSSFILRSDNERNKFCKVDKLVRDDAQEMSRNLSVADVKHDGRTSYKSNRNDSTRTPRNAQRSLSPKDIKASNSAVPRTISPRTKKDSAGSLSPRRNIETIQFNLPLKSRSNKTSIAARSPIPYYKIVAGTHFAVDAFSYGEIPNVRHYFLTHFHSDHYTGLKKSFNKLLFCSKITADLCMSRLGVSSKCIQVINVNETLRIEGVEVTVVDANHVNEPEGQDFLLDILAKCICSSCPGAIMLVFSLPSGKTMLHTGDFRASPYMESFPVFWNKDVHTIYLDTTYCNPRYDFPTQDQSLEMALFLLRQKKMALEKIGKKFSSVLIICGTYTIGKEKFFLGMARRVGCSVWACPEKDRVLQAVEGHSFSRASPESCQLHVVPMRDLTHEKLRSYLDSLQGAFSEVVAFKPSGWENGKNSSVEKDSVTIHGIPYSEHSSFSELIRFVKFLKPKQVVPTVNIPGGIKAVQKFFPCPLVNKDDIHCQSKVTDYFSIHGRQQATAVT